MARLKWKDEQRAGMLRERVPGGLDFDHPGRQYPPEMKPSENRSTDKRSLTQREQRKQRKSRKEGWISIGWSNDGGPKVLVGVDASGRMISGAADLPGGYQPFLVKFAAREDGEDIGAVEAAYALVAAEAGVDVPATRLFKTPDGGRYFGAVRFDRRDGRRVHMQTLGGLLHASHRLPSVDYEGFLKATLVLTRDQRQVEQAYRRMAFNVLAHNRDDHVKNVSYLMSRDGAWKLSPAYDLVFSEGPGGVTPWPWPARTSGRASGKCCGSRTAAR